MLVKSSEHWICLQEQYIIIENEKKLIIGIVFNIHFALYIKLT